MDVTIFLMRDKQTFVPLDSCNPEAALEKAMALFDDGETFGMPCAVVEGQHYPRVVHGKGRTSRDDFEAQARVWLEGLKNISLDYDI